MNDPWGDPWKPPARLVTVEEIRDREERSPGYLKQLAEDLALDGAAVLRLAAKGKIYA